MHGYGVPLSAAKTTSARKYDGPRSLSIWQYILLGGPSQTCAAYSGLIFRHKENYVDITWLSTQDYDGSCVGKEVPMEQYGSSSSEDIEGGSVDHMFSNAYPDSMSIRPTIISIVTLLALMLQFGAGIMCGMVFTLESPSVPYVPMVMSFVSLVVFFSLTVPSFYYWAIESEHMAYVPLISANGVGTFSHALILLLFVFWTIDNSGIPSSISYEDAPLMYLKYAVICALYFAFTVLNVIVYTNTVISGYQQYVSRFPVVYRYVEERKQQQNRSTMISDYPPRYNQAMIGDTTSCSTHVYPWSGSPFPIDTTATGGPVSSNKYTPEIHHAPTVYTDNSSGRTYGSPGHTYGYQVSKRMTSASRPFPRDHAHARGGIGISVGVPPGDGTNRGFLPSGEEDQHSVGGSGPPPSSQVIVEGGGAGEDEDVFEPSPFD